MEKPQKVLESMRRLLSDSRGWDRPGQVAAFATFKILIREFDEYVEDHKIGGWGYLQEKLASLNFHIAALYQFDEDNGHDADSHHVWALGDIEVLSRNIPGEREWGDLGS